MCRFLQETKIGYRTNNFQLNVNVIFYLLVIKPLLFWDQESLQVK
jgi:hypothetical protein